MQKNNRVLAIENEREIYTMQYASSEYGEFWLFSDGSFAVDSEHFDGYLFKELIEVGGEQEYETHNCLIVEKDGIFGVIGDCGNMLLPLEYTDIQVIKQTDFYTKLMCVQGNDFDDYSVSIKTLKQEKCRFELVDDEVRQLGGSTNSCAWCMVN